MSRAYTIALSRNGKVVAKSRKGKDIIPSDNIYKTIRQEVEAEFGIDVGLYSVHSIHTDKVNRIITIEITEEHMADLTRKRREILLGDLGV